MMMDATGDRWQRLVRLASTANSLQGKRLGCAAYNKDRRIFGSDSMLASPMEAAALSSFEIED